VKQEGTGVPGGKAWKLLTRTFSDWSEDKAPELGAALAFYTALSIAPLLVIVLGLAAYFFGDNAASGQVVGELRTLVGNEGGKAIEDMIASANKPTTGVIATSLSVVTLLFGASGVFAQLQSALNTIWEVKPKPGRGVWRIIRERFLSLTMVLGMSFLLVVSLIFTAAVAAATNRLSGDRETLAGVVQVVNFVASFALLTVLFALMFKVLPDVKMAWSDVWIGAGVTAALFVVGKLVIGLYLGHSSMASSYGVAGSFVVLLVWVYYSAQILFFGAELTQVYANEYGSKILPDENAEPLTDEARAQAGRPRRPAVPATKPR
jgi:membrane protein